MSNIFLSSDMHFRHKNIIKYSNRPFTSVEEMEEALIANHNSRVRPGDTWYHLGDFAFCGSDGIASILPKLNGRKIFLKGNHDHKKNFVGLVDEFYNDWFGKMGNLIVHAYHFPCLSWNGAHHGSVHLHGHSHGSTNNEGVLRFDVGVDCFNMFPVSIDEIEVLVAKKKETIDTSKMDPGRNRE